MDIYKELKKLTQKQYTISFYTGGVNVENWSQLSIDEKQKALSVPWYLLWRYRNPQTGKLERMNNLKLGVNRHKTMSGRMEQLRHQKVILIKLLDGGTVPDKFMHLVEKKKTTEVILGEQENTAYTIIEAFEKAIKEKEKQNLAKSTIDDYKKAVKLLLKFIGEKNHYKNIDQITKSTINQFLSHRLETVTARTVNNNRCSLSALYSEMAGTLNIVRTNFIKNDIEPLEAKSEKNKAYTPSEVKLIFELAKEKDIMLYHYLAHVFLGFFRLKEVVMIQANHVDLERKVIESDTKTYKFHKQIPQVLIDNFYSKYNLSILKDKFMFTKDNEPSYHYTGKLDKEGNKLIAHEDERRAYWTKRFNRKIKKPLGFSTNHTANSMRHSGIGVLFNTLTVQYQEKEYPDYEDRALNAVMKHTGHDTVKAVRKYLREIGYYNIPDWSDLMNSGFY